MSFFGPGSLLSGYEPTPPGGLDPQLYKALMSAFPGLQGLGGQQGQQPTSLQSLGYQGTGPQFFQGQGQGSFQNLSPFEGAKGFGSESITGGLASGTLGKSSSQQQPTGSGLLSLPQLQLPQAIASQQASYGADTGGTGAVGGEPQGGVTIGAGDILSGGQSLLDLFGGGPTLGTQTQTPGYQAYRQGERTDYSNATGSPSGIPQLALPNYFDTGQRATIPTGNIGPTPAGMGDVMFGQGGAVIPNAIGPTPAGIGDMLPGSETMMAPGGSAQTALGQPTPQGDLLGGGISTLQGLLSLYGGAQSGDIGQLLGGAGGTIGGLGQMAPAQVAALEASLGLGAGTLGLAAGGLGGLAGGYGLYQGIQQGDPLQALMGGAGLYAGAAPLVNAAFGTALPTLSSLGSSALGALGLGGTGAATAGAAGGAAATGGAAGGGAAAGAGAGAGAAAGLGAGTGVAAALMAPIIWAMLAEGFDPIGDSLKTDAYKTFVPELMQNVGQQNTAFGTLQQALPYVQSQEELGQLLNTYKNYLGTTTGITPEQWGGSYTGDPYSIGKIPGVGPVTHGEQTGGVDFGPQTQALQGIVDQMLGVLPGQRITAQYGQPGGGLEGEAGMRLWQQFMDRERNAPVYERGTTPSQIEAFNLDPSQIVAPGFYGQIQTPDALRYGQEGYQYAGSGGQSYGGVDYPMPGQYIGQQSPYWATVEQNLYNASPQGQYNQQLMQALQQYQSQLGALQGQLPQFAQAAQVTPTSGLDAGVLAALNTPTGMANAVPGGLQSGVGGGMNQGVDLMALLRQLGYAA